MPLILKHSDKHFRVTHFHASVFYTSGCLLYLLVSNSHVGPSSQSGQQKYPLQPPCQGEVDKTMKFFNKLLVAHQCMMLAQIKVIF